MGRSCVDEKYAMRRKIEFVWLPLNSWRDFEWLHLCSVQRWNYS